MPPGHARRSITPMTPHRLASLFVLFALAGIATACGSDSSSSDPGSANYDPAKTTLQDAGLEVCDEVDEQVPQTLSSGPGVSATRSFTVAKDCNGAKATPNGITVFQFDSRESVDAGEAKIKAEYPDASTLKSGPLIVVATGPAREENIAAVQQALESSSSS